MDWNHRHEGATLVAFMAPLLGWRCSPSISQKAKAAEILSQLGLSTQQVINAAVSPIVSGKSQ
jgi:hypothetical protein